MQVICSHENLDFDGLAAMIGIRKLYPDAKILLPNKLSQPVKEFFALYKDTFEFYSATRLETEINTVDTVILVDTNKLNRVNFAYRAVQAGARLVIFDHHPVTEPIKNSYTGIIEPLGASSTIIVEQLQKKGISLDSVEATVLAMGIYQDTGSLRFPGTTGRDAKALAYLLEAGANLAVINTFLERPLSIDQQQLYNQLAAGAEEKWVNGNQILLASAKSSKYVGGVAVISHKLGEVFGADAVIVLVASPRQVDLVARSRADWIRVDELMRQFGGGGHPKAGAAKVKNAGLDEILPQLESLLPVYISAPLTAKDLMSSPVKSIKPQQTIAEAARLMLRYGHSGMPVVEEGKLVGIISRRDVDKAVVHNLGHAPVKAYMSRHVKTVHPDTPITQIEDMMIDNDIGRLPVCDNSTLVGIVSRTDLLRTMHREYQSRFATNFRDHCPVLGVEIKDVLLQRMEPELLTILRNIGELGQRRGEKVYLVGGIVRDLILGCSNIDVDIVVEGDGPQLAREVAEQLDARVRVHDTFQTASILIPNGYKLDFVSARTEYYAYPAALPSVESAKLKEDLYRRDFTVNAMAISLNPDTFGGLVDYYCGYRDVTDGLIRVLHNLSFVEDPTRIIRALRFASKYGWQIEDETYGFLVRAVQEGRLKQVSLPRLWHELKHILLEDNPLPALRALAELQIEAQLFPGIKWNNDVFGRLSAARQSMLKLKSACSFTPWRVYLTVLLSPYALLQVQDILKKVELNKKDRQVIEDVFALKSGIPGDRAQKMNSLATLHKHYKHLPPDTVLAIALLSGSEAVLQETCVYLVTREINRPKLSGNDLIALGAKPGPQMGVILEKLELAWLTGKVSSKGEELSLAQELIKGVEQNAHA